MPVSVKTKARVRARVPPGPTSAGLWAFRRPDWPRADGRGSGGPSGLKRPGLVGQREDCWYLSHSAELVLVSCTVQLDLVGAKSLISRAALKRPKPLLTVKLARLPPVFLIIARVQTKSL